MSKAGLMLAVPLLAAAVPAAAQAALDEPTGAFRSPTLGHLDEPSELGRSGVSFRVSDTLEPDGTRRERRGIIAGFEVAPDAVLGVGLFERLPKQVLPSEERPDRTTKRSRKAAIGLTLKF